MENQNLKMSAVQIWHTRIDGKEVLVKATQGQMEWQYMNGNWGDYTRASVYVLPKNAPTLF